MSTVSVTDPTFSAAPAPERRQRLRADTWGIMDERVLAPVAVEIQPTAHCHRTCAFCSHIVRNRRGGQLSGTEVVALLDELNGLGVTRIAFSGGGEPLYWAAGRLVDAVVHAARFADVSLTTSGDHLLHAGTDTLHHDAAVLLRHCSTLYFNIPAVDEASFRKQVSGPTGWDHTRRMLSGLVALKGSDPSLTCRLQAVVVISAFNVGQVAAIDSTLMGLGVDGIYYKQWKNFENRNVARVRLEDQAMVDALMMIPSEQRSRDLSGFIDLLSTELPGGAPCWVNRMGLNAVVDPNGDIFLCTPTVGMPQHAVGNLDDSFSACWTSAARAEILRRLDGMSSAGTCPRECRYHGENHQLQASLETNT